MIVAFEPGGGRNMVWTDLWDLVSDDIMQDPHTILVDKTYLCVSVFLSGWHEMVCLSDQ